MAETLRELVVALSLDSSNFSRNMRTINQQIKEAESTFRLAGAGVENYEKTIAGMEAKLSMLGNKLTQQQAGRHVFMTECRWRSSVDECQPRKFSAKNPEDMLKLGSVTSMGLPKYLWKLLAKTNE